jgi:hypothetical protein
MKSNLFKMIFMLMAVAAFGIYQAQGQTEHTHLSGNGANTSCSPMNA